VAKRMGEASEQLKMLAMRVRQGADAMVAELEAKQAKIDALMLEFCPDEMKPEQRENWARAQRRVPRTFGGDGAVKGGDGQADGAASRRTAGTPPRTISMTGQQVMEVLTLVVADCFQVVNRDSEVEFARETFREQMESEVTIGFVEAHVTKEGEARPAGLYAWLTEYPEEGSVQLGGEEVPPEALPATTGALVSPAAATGLVPEGQGLIFGRAKWPSLDEASRSEQDSRLVAHGTVPVMDERGEDYVFHLTVHTADPDAERLLAALCTRAVNSVPRVIDAMDFALRKLRSVDHLLKKGDTSVAKQSLEAALQALTGKSAVAEEGEAR
jgi:hypothetical protein